MNGTDKLKALVSALAETAAAAYAIHLFFWEIFAFDPVLRRFVFQEAPVWAAPVSGVIAAFLLLFLPLRKQGWTGLKESAANWIVLIPAGLLLLIPFTATPLPLLGAFLLIAWGCRRHCVGTGDMLPFEDRVKKLTPRGGLLFSLLLAAAGCGWGFHMQEAAYNRLFLFYSDWGIYAEHYLKLASGGGALRDWLVAGGHWNGALNLLMTAAFLVSPSPETMFLMNSVLIYSAVPLIYLLGRQLKLPAAAAAAFCAFFVLTPVVSNQPLSLFYSFHPINILPGCFLLFFLFRERKWRTAAVGVLVFTLFVQETAAIFWFGYALVLAFEKKFKTAAVLAVSMAVIFVVLSHWVIPERAITTVATAGENYTQMFHFSQLGNTPFEVALSPVLRPAAFFGTLFAVNNLEFVLFLLLPFVFLVPYYPKLLLAGLPLLAGVILQSSRDLQNVVLQYGVELNCLVIVSAIFGASRLYAKGDRRKLRGALAAALFGVAALYLLAGKSPSLGKYSFSMILERPESERLIVFLKSCLPPGETVYAPQRIRAHLLFDNPTRDPGEKATPGAIYILEAQEGSDTDGVRQKLLLDPTVIPVTCANWYGYEFAVFRKLNTPVPPPKLPFLRAVTPEEFAGFGPPVESDSKEFRIRRRTTEHTVQLLFRLVRKTEGEFRFRVRLTRGTQSVPYQVTFANGLRAVSQVEPGTAFFAEFPLPEGSGPTAANVEILHSR